MDFSAIRDFFFADFSYGAFVKNETGKHKSILLVGMQISDAETRLALKVVISDWQNSIESQLPGDNPSLKLW